MLNKKDKKSEIKELKKQCEEWENKYKRALADYQNLLKQTAREKEEFAKYAAEQFLYNILPVYDNLKMAIKHNSESDSWLEGVKYVVRQFRSVLEEIGVTEIKTKGEKFSHKTMEAVESKETHSKKKDGLVANVLKSGYTLHGKVIVPAKVVVYKFTDNL